MRALAVVLVVLGCTQAPEIPAPIGRAEGRVSRIRSRADIDLHGPRVDARAGDFLLENSGMLAVVTAAGHVVDYGPRGGRDEMVGVEPSVFRGLEAEVLTVVRAAPVGAALFVEKRLVARPLQLRTWIYFSGPALAIESSLVGEAAGAPLTLGEVVAWGNLPTFVEGHGFAVREGSNTGEFIAREGFGTAYALYSAGGRITARIPPFDLPGFNPSLSTGEEVGGRHRAVLLTHSARSLGDAVLSLPHLARRLTVLAALPRGLPPRTRVEVRRCLALGPYLEVLATGKEVELPAGCIRARLTAPGHAPGPWLESEQLHASPLPSAGRLRFRVNEAGRGAIPARILVRGRDATPDPSFGEEPREGAALNVVYSERGAGEQAIPPGRYRVVVDRGFEYTIHEEDVVVAAGRTATVQASLTRVVDTRGWISADLHLHAAPSPDAPAGLEDRIRSLAAVGVEVGVATDHNAVTDYGPVIRRMGMGRWVASVVGDEITTKETLFGHFNAFPLAPETPPIEWRDTEPRRIFAAVRAARPYGKDTILQVNHPRMRDLGYFELTRFDPGDIEGWAKRTPHADLGFDAIEVFNGDYYERKRLFKVEECLRDWYALLNSGRRYTATGNSDSHKLTYHEAGVPRNLVAVADDDPAKLDERAFVESIRRGRVVVSSGPFVQLWAGGVAVGGEVAAGEVEVVVRVDAPPWVDVDRVELVRRGEVVRSWRGPFAAGVTRLRAAERMRLRPGDWLIALARGSRPMSHLHRPDAAPFGFTNPVWVK
jgi:hypothetical protein